MVSHWGHAVGYDCDRPSPSYSYQIHFIHIKGVWHPLYMVGSHISMSLLRCYLPEWQVWWKESVGFWHVILLCNDWDLSSTSYLYQFTSYIEKVFDILCMWWAVIWACPYSTNSHGQVWCLAVVAGLGIRMVLVLIVGYKYCPQTTYTHIKSIILYVDTSLGYFIYLCCELTCEWVQHTSVTARRWRFVLLIMSAQARLSTTNM